MARSGRHRPHQRDLRERHRIRSWDLVRLCARRRRPHVRRRHAGGEQATTLARYRHRPLQLPVSREARRPPRSDASFEAVRGCSHRLRAGKDQTNDASSSAVARWEDAPRRCSLRMDTLAMACFCSPIHCIRPASPTNCAMPTSEKSKAPVLCLNGTRDPLCTQDLMERTVAGLGSNWTMHWLAGADHSFHVLKSSGRTDSDVLTELGETVSAWEKAVSRKLLSTTPADRCANLVPSASSSCMK